MQNYRGHVDGKLRTFGSMLSCARREITSVGVKFAFAVYYMVLMKAGWEFLFRFMVLK